MYSLSLAPGIVEGLQIGVNLVTHVAGKKTKFLSGLNCWAREDNLARLTVFQRSHCQCHGEIGLARSCRTEGKREVVLVEGLDHELLVGSASLDGLSVHAIDYRIIHLEFLGWKPLDGVEDNVLG